MTEDIRQAALKGAVRDLSSAIDGIAQALQYDDIASVRNIVRLVNRVMSDYPREWFFDDTDSGEPGVHPRPVIMKFARSMELKLRANDHKVHWRDMDAADLCAGLREEVDELFAEVEAERVDQGAIRLEAADVANIAMMIADSFGGLTDS